jgi:hypothetical protein
MSSVGAFHAKVDALGARIQKTFDDVITASGLTTAEAAKVMIKATEANKVANNSGTKLTEMINNNRA